ncbi:peroxisomal membrane protein pex14 [Mactra antiquata]
MADSDTKSELSKEVLAPAVGVREDLVNTAVKFLQNPKVHQSPISQKKAFLQRKGLTLEEIEVAVSRAGVKSNQENVERSQQVVPSVQTGPNTVVAVKGDEISRWVKVRDVMAVITMVTGISYAAYKFYKEILAPWIFGLQTKEQRIDKLERAVTESIDNVNKTLASIEETLGKQQEKILVLSHDVNSKMGPGNVDTMQSNAGITEVKNELSSIKGLLLNRRQFPPVPTTTPVLPSWQLATNSGDADSNDKGTDETAEVTNKITLSPHSAAEDLKGKDSNDTENDKIPENPVIVAKNSTDLENIQTKTDNDQSEANIVQNEAKVVQNKAAGQTSDLNASGDNNDSEGNESLD